MKKVSVAIFGVIALFCLTNFAHATEQLTHDTNVSAPGTGNFTQWGGQYLGTGLNDVFSAVTIWGTFPVNAGLTVDICEATSESGFYGMGSGQMACPTNKATGTLTEAKSNEEVSVTLNNSVTLDPSKYYAIRLTLTDQSGCVIYGSADDGSYSGGTFGTYGYQNNYPQFFRTYTDPVKDLYFILGSPPPSYSISFDSPTNSQTLNDFYHWDFDYTAPYGPLLTYGIEVYYSTSSGVSSTVFDHYDVGGNLPGGELATAQIMKAHLLGLGQWYAKAYLLDDEGNEIASSDEISFTITLTDLGSGASDYEPPPTVECGSTDFICQIGNWFSNVIPSIGKYLFVPSSSVLNKYQEIWPSISEKVPIGYFPLISDAVQNITEGTGAYELPEIDFFDTIRTAVGVLIWVLFGFWLIKRISVMQV